MMMKSLLALASVGSTAAFAPSMEVSRLKGMVSLRRRNCEIGVQPRRRRVSLHFANERHHFISSSRADYSMM